MLMFNTFMIDYYYICYYSAYIIIITFLWCLIRKAKNFFANIVDVLYCGQICERPSFVGTHRQSIYFEAGPVLVLVARTP